MRILPGPPQGFANETTTSNHLIRHAVNMPTFLAKLPSLFKDETPLTSLLSKRGNVFGSNDFTAIASKGYTQVGSKEVRWRIEGHKNRVLNIVRDFVCEEYPNEPGRNGSAIFLYADTNWASPRDVVELADNRTYLWYNNDLLPREVETGVWEYKFVLLSKDKSEFVNPELLREGQDFSVSYNMFEELSVTAYEKYTFDEEARTFMTIMRLKHSISGTASAMSANTPMWIEHNGVNMWVTKQELDMMKRWAVYRENQLLFGKGTVNDKGQVVAKLDNSNIEVMAGDGLMNQGDGIWKMPYQQLTVRILESMMNNLAVSHSYKGGDTAVAVLCGRSFSNDFIRIMKDVAGSDPKVVVETKGGGKAIDVDYEYYKWNGIKFYPVVWNYFDSPERAGRMYVDQYGNRLESRRAIFMNLGDIKPGEPTIELLALGDRQFKKGTVHGINRGGDSMPNSVDGEHTHILSETGIANKDLDGIAELYVPVMNRNTFFVSRN